MAHRTATPTRNLRDLIMLVGAEEAAKHVRPLTADEMVLVEQALAKHGGSHAAALGVRDPKLAAEVDGLFAHCSKQ